MNEQTLASDVSRSEPGMIVRPDTPLRRSWREFRRHIPGVVGLVILLLLLVLSLAAPLITGYSPTKQNLSVALQTPSVDHLLGTDYLGRDLLTRLLYGGRLSLTIGFLAVAIGVAVGVPLGAVSGYYGSWPDLLIQRLADILLSFPSFLFALILVALLGVGVRNVIISVGILAIPSFIRLVRGTVLVLRELDYVQAARSVGATDLRVILRHIAPNAMTPIIVNASLNLGYAITMAAGLGFLGLGVQPPTPEWGMMLGEARNYIFSHPYMITFPGLIIFITIVGLNLVGDALRDALDPRVSKQTLS